MEDGRITIDPNRRYTRNEVMERLRISTYRVYYYTLQILSITHGVDGRIDEADLIRIRDYRQRGRFAHKRSGIARPMDAYPRYTRNEVMELIGISTHRVYYYTLQKLGIVHGVDGRIDEVDLMRIRDYRTQGRFTNKRSGIARPVESSSSPSS